MAQKTIGGISGVLGELISPTPTSVASPRKDRPSVAFKNQPLLVRAVPVLAGPRATLPDTWAPKRK
jgi:hypothetical protein